MLMLIEVEKCDFMDLHEYFVRLGQRVPYYFPAGLECWRESMFADRDYDGKPLFKQLCTYALISDGVVGGFVQYGLTNFVFTKDGEKDYSNTYAVIRNLHFVEGAEDAHLLIEKAHEFFTTAGIAERYAFFHFFGMSCYARQGKLHLSQPHVEELLSQYGYRKEHENVYFSRRLSAEERYPYCDIDFICSNGGQDIAFVSNGEAIGGCELFFVPQSDVCFLKHIYINKEFHHQGFGTACMYKLLAALRSRGIARLDTDTTDGNLNAQDFYIKTGFANMGRMRSYARGAFI